MRNIVVFIDGTGQDRSKQEIADRTNVARLHDGCRDIANQYVKYCNGVGTDPGEMFTGNAFGRGLDSRIIEAYIFLQQEVGIAKRNGKDFRVYLFGFSRGAFAVRWLAAVIKFSGIPDFEISERFGLVNRWNGNKKAADELRQTGAYYDVPVEMIGVWDTVQATKTSDFGVKELPDNVAGAYHSMALDEYRSKFEITRFNPNNKVTEVWFAGCRADVGGGYSDGIVTANVTLSWMIDMAKEHGLIVDMTKIPRFNEAELGDVQPVIHDEMVYDKKFSLGDLFKKKFWVTTVWHITNLVKGEKSIYELLRRLIGFINQ